MIKPLYEQYRPQSWGEVIGQDKAIQKIEAMKRRGLGGRAYWIAGQSGTGKTTLARLLALEIADKLNVIEVDGGDCSLDFILGAAPAPVNGGAEHENQ
jgi:DNA polymerase III subunit gamma/tau